MNWCELSCIYTDYCHDCEEEGKKALSFEDWYKTIWEEMC